MNLINIHKLMVLNLKDIYEKVFNAKNSLQDSFLSQNTITQKRRIALGIRQ